MSFERLTSLARHQHGLITIGQTSALGWSRGRWYQACTDGRLVPVMVGVARLAGAPDTVESRVLAPVLRLGPGAMVSHLTAAWLWGVDDAPPLPVHVTVADRARRPRLHGIVVHRPTDHDDLGPMRRRGIPVTNPLRVLVDLGAVAPEVVPRALAHFAVAGKVSPRSARAALDRHARQGRAGVGALRCALDDWVFGDRPPDSVLEVAMARLLRRNGLPEAEFHAVVAGIEVDFLIRGTRLVIECDGWQWHGLDRRRFDGDRERDAHLGRHGYVVRRFTWQQITRRGGWVAEVIRDHLPWCPAAN